MMRLLRVELRRLFSRRLVVLATAGALVVTGMLLFGVWQSSQPMSGAERAQAQAEYERARADWEQNGEEYMAQCLADEELERETSGRVVDYGCEDMEPKEEWFLHAAPPLEESLPGVLSGGAFQLLFLAFLVGATFTAAEASTGSLSNWLTFEPRRIRVYGSKLLAAAVGILPVTAVLLGLVVAGAWAIAGSFGLAEGMTAQDWSDAAATAGRILALSAVVAAVAAALGFLLRHTAAVLGVAVGYVVVVELMLSGYLERFQPWLVGKNVDGWISHGTTYFVNTCTTDSTGTLCEYTERSLAFGHSAAYLLVLFAALVLAGGLVFRRRDVV
jgi:ABC-2 type transport system permease protein